MSGYACPLGCHAQPPKVRQPGDRIEWCPECGNPLPAIVADVRDDNPAAINWHVVGAAALCVALWALLAWLVWA